MAMRSLVGYVLGTCRPAARQCPARPDPARAGDNLFNCLCSWRPRPGAARAGRPLYLAAAIEDKLPACWGPPARRSFWWRGDIGGGPVGRHTLALQGCCRWRSQAITYAAGGAPSCGSPARWAEPRRWLASSDFSSSEPSQRIRPKDSARRGQLVFAWWIMIQFESSPASSFLRGWMRQLGRRLAMAIILWRAGL